MDGHDDCFTDEIHLHVYRLSGTYGLRFHQGSDGNAAKDICKPCLLKRRSILRQKSSRGSLCSCYGVHIEKAARRLQARDVGSMPSVGTRPSLSNSQRDGFKLATPYMTHVPAKIPRWRPRFRALTHVMESLARLKAPTILGAWSA